MAQRSKSPSCPRVGLGTACALSGFDADHTVDGIELDRALAGAWMRGSMSGHDHETPAGRSADSGHDPTAHRLHTAYELAHWGHTGAEALVHGGATLEHVAHGAQEFALLNGRLSGPATGVGLMGAFLAPLSLIAGGWQMYQGFSHGGIDGALDVPQGAATAFSGVATIAGLAGSALAAKAAPAAAAFAGGMALGRYGDRAAARYGVFGEGEDGRNRSASDWMADTMEDADDWVAATTGSEALGTAAAWAAGLGTSLVGGGGAAMAAVAGGGEAAADLVVPTRSLADQIDHQRALRQRKMARAVQASSLKRRVLRAAQSSLPSASEEETNTCDLMDLAFGE